jgi:universal stress protein A
MAAADLGDKLRHQVDERLQAALTHAAVAGERVVVDGPAAQAILQAATDRHADLVVMGTIGRTGLKRALLGSVAEAVVRHAPCSVLVVRLTRADG